MRNDVSLWLDALRALASFAVFVAHVKLFGVADPSLVTFVPQLGHDAVILFFVLSGFVIAFTTDARNASLPSYLSARGARIYSVALPAAVLTYVLASIGATVAPAEYDDRYQLEKLWLYIPFTLAFLGELWTLSEPPLANVPWWSLGYEVWYYVLFAIYAFYRGARRWLFLAIGLLLVGYKLWLLAPTWLIGAVLWKQKERLRMSRGLARTLLIGSVLGYAGYKFSGAEDWLVEIGNRPFGGVEATALGSARSYLHDYVVAMFAVVHLLGLSHAHLSFPRAAVRPIRFFASFTFSLYLAHAPMLIFAKSVLPYDPTNVWHVLGVVSGILLFIVAFGFVTEHRKGPYRRFFDALVASVARVVTRRPALAALLAPRDPVTDGLGFDRSTGVR
ncbi:MAG: acyltransferase family protein [Planctomycetota bacterium]